MLTDVRATWISYSRELANILGLDAGVYVSQLSIPYLDGKYDNEGFILINRENITKLTSLTNEEQLKIDTKLVKAKLMEKDVLNSDRVSLNMSLIRLIMSGKIVEIDGVSKVVKGKKGSVKKQDRNYAIAEGLKKKVNTGSQELDVALYSWIDSIIKGKENFLNEFLINVFIKKLNEYTKGDLSVALELVNLATLYAYREFDWVKRIYEKDKSYKVNSKVQQTSNNLSNKKF